MKTRMCILLCLAFSVSVSATAQNFSSYPIVVRPIDTDINTAENDYAPFLSIDRGTMYFTSYRGAGSRGEADIYRAARSGERWAAAANAGDVFNTGDNDGALAIAADNTSVVFASEERPGGLGDTDLWLGRLVNGVLSDVRNPGAVVNSTRWDSQPTLSGDGTTLIFSSDRPGGKGGADLWIATSDNWGTFREARPLGTLINTSGNECAPYLTPDGGTLYFASDGHGGYGGYDIWMSIREGDTWTAPVNLGPVINSDEDDLFFHAPAKDREFFLASARRGGYGGLDIYAGTPNVFGAGMFRMVVRVIDSVSGAPLPSIVTVTDAETGGVVASFVTNSQADEYAQLLPAGRAYKVEASIREYPPRSALVVSTPPNTEAVTVLRFGPITVAEFDLGKYNVPFFVTGYYRPNTKQNLAELFGKLSGPLSQAGYIERFKEQSKRHQQYQAYAETVEGIFQTVYTAGVDEIFPRFKAAALPGEALEIRVIGYADPQPIVGVFHEEHRVDFVDASGVAHSVDKGERLDNLKLSGLRAHFSAEYLDELFSASAAKGLTTYKELRDAGRIRYVVVGGDVSRDQNDFAAQRRIRITMSRVGNAPRGADSDFDLNKRYK